MTWVVHGDSSLPLAAEGTKWSPAAARERMFARATSGKVIDVEQAMRGFVIHDADMGQDQERYILPFADVIDGELVAIPDAVREIFKSLVHGMVPAEILANTRDDARRLLDAYFSRMRKPLGDGAKMVRIDRSVRFGLKAEGDALVAEETSQGFLRIAPSKLARDGVLMYSDGVDEWLELRPADELVKAAESFSLVPLTDDHPPEMVTSQNVRYWQAGTVGDVRVEVVDGVTYIVAPILITDPGLIQRARAGETAELSIGFLARVWEKEGATPDGSKFKFVQTDLEGNHVAVVEEGRAGPTCALAAVGDAAWQLTQRQETENAMAHANIIRKDMEMAPAAPAPVPAPAAEPQAPAEPAPQPAAAPEMVTVQIPGVGPVEMSATLATVVQALMQQISQMQPAPVPAAPVPDQSAAAEASADAKEEDASENEDAKKEDDDMKKNDSAEVQRLQGVVDGLKGRLDSYLTSEDERIDARVALVTDARKVLGDEVSLRGLKPEQIMAKVVVALDGDSAIEQLKDASVEYVQGRYDAALAVFNKAPVADESSSFDTYTDSGDGKEPSLADVIDASTTAMGAKWKSNRAS